jgi:hypothetical protein
MADHPLSTDDLRKSPAGVGAKAATAQNRLNATRPRIMFDGIGCKGGTATSSTAPATSSNTTDRC